MNQARVARYGNTIVYPIPYSCFVAAAMVVQYFTHYVSAALSKAAGLRTFREVFFASRTTVNRCLKIMLQNELNSDNDVISPYILKSFLV